MTLSIQQQQNNRNNAFIPTGFLPGKTTFFTINNVDIKIDTPDEINQLPSKQYQYIRKSNRL